MRNKRFILTLFVVAFALIFSSFAFAAFSSNLTISGTVKGEGNFDVYFAKSTEGYYTEGDVLLAKNGANTPEVTVKSSGADTEGGAHDYLNVKIALPNTNKVDVTFPVTVYNNGTVPAVIDVVSVNSGVFTVATTQKVTVGSKQTATVYVKITSSSTLTQKAYDDITLEIVAVQEPVDTAPTVSHSQH